MHKVKASAHKRLPKSHRRAHRTQYTLRSIPPGIDAALRDASVRTGRSLNDLALEALARGLGLEQFPRPKNDLLRFAGTWVEDPEFDAAIKEFDRIDPEDWK